eukprot:c20565_g1_i5.p1 GENE.c20565_g1_i5~~c20565_g1_i5.p1  ORF type:complete len:423 (+),score=68.88 c20565_g1_i5:168-1436(+)
MMLGVLDNRVFDDSDTPSNIVGMCLFVVFTIFVSIVMFNVVISIIGNTFERAKQISDVQFQVERSALVVENSVVYPHSRPKEHWIQILINRDQIHDRRSERLRMSRIEPESYVPVRAYKATGRAAFAEQHQAITELKAEVQELRQALSSHLSVERTQTKRANSTQQASEAAFPSSIKLPSFKLLPTTLRLKTQEFETVHIYKVDLVDDSAAPYLRFLDDVGVLSTGRFSPVYEFEMRIPEKLALSIPTDAKYFGVAFPLDGISHLEQHLRADLSLVDAGFMFLQFGGMIYFDAKHRPLSCSAFQPVQSESGVHDLMFLDPKAWKKDVTAGLDAQLRFNHITIEKLKKAGAQLYTWLNPNEVLISSEVTSNPEWNDWEFGAFAYLFHEDALDSNEKDCYVAVDPDCNFAAALRKGKPSLHQGE